MRKNKYCLGRKANLEIYHGESKTHRWIDLLNPFLTSKIILLPMALPLSRWFGRFAVITVFSGIFGLLADRAHASLPGCKEFELANPFHLSALLQDQPWIKYCSTLTLDQSRDSEEIRQTYLTREALDNLKHSDLLIDKLKEFESTSGVSLDNLGILKYDLGVEVNLQAIEPRILPLQSIIWEAYQKFALLAAGQVRNFWGKERTLIPVSAEVVREARARVVALRQVLAYLQAAYPHSFNCQLANSNLYSYLMFLPLKAKLNPEAEDEGRGNKKTGDLTQAKRVTQQTNLTSDLEVGPSIEVDLALRVLDSADISLEDPFIKGPGRGEKQFSSSDLKNVHDFSLIIDVLHRDGFLPVDPSYVCKADENSENKAAQKTNGPEQQKIVSGPCLQKGLEDVIALDPLPLGKGSHFNGAGYQQCQFILAQWQSNGRHIPKLLGRFINETGHEVRVQCQSLQMTGGKLQILSRECTEMPPLIKQLGRQ